MNGGLDKEIRSKYWLKIEKFFLIFKQPPPGNFFHYKKCTEFGDIYNLQVHFKYPS